MLLVQLLLPVFTALPLPAPARAAAAAPDAGLWVMVCTPQGMKQVLLQTLLTADAQPAPDAGDELSGGSGHCLLCQQQHSPALPALPALPAAPSTLAAATSDAPPDWRPSAPRPSAPAWRPLRARAPPAQA